jgi:hypothetical protein
MMEIGFAPGGPFYYKDTIFTVWPSAAGCISLCAYSTDAPIEQVSFHWEKRRLLPFSER